VPQPYQADLGSGEDVRSGPDTVLSSAADSRWRSLDRTGNVRLLSAEEMADRARAASEASGAAAKAAASRAASPGAATAAEVSSGEPASPAAVSATPVEPSAGPAPATTSAAAASQPATDLPLPSYDDLSLPSIRARLRGLDVHQLRILAEYEARNAERTDVLGMLERRIQKLESGS
jgi:hypothetical protein